MRANPAEPVRWCDLGCSWEGTDDQTKTTEDGAMRCPKCGGRTVDMGWRYRNSRGVFETASTFETLPPDVRKETTR